MKTAVKLILAALLAIWAAAAIAGAAFRAGQRDALNRAIVCAEFPWYAETENGPAYTLEAWDLTGTGEGYDLADSAVLLELDGEKVSRPLFVY